MGQAADAAEEIKLPGTDAQIDAVRLQGYHTAGIGAGKHDTLPDGAGIRLDGGIQLGPLDPVHGPGPFHIQGGHPEITVVLQGRGNDRLQAWIGEELPPFQVGGDRRRRGGGRVLIGRTGGPLVGDGGCRPGVFRRQGAAGETDEHDEDEHGVPVHINGPPGNLRRPHRVRCHVPAFGKGGQTRTKKNGIKKRSMKVADSIPPVTAVPMAFLAPAPAPAARARGRTPKKKANEVMRTGRNRNRAASRVASISPAPWASRFPGELDDQDGVFGGQAQGGDKADLKVDIIGQAPQTRWPRRRRIRPNGNIRMLVKGMVQLSYRAATHRKMTITEKA